MKLNQGQPIDMNICMFTNTYLPHVGGVANSIETFRTDLESLGHDVLIITPEFPSSDENTSQKEPHVLRIPAIQNFNGSDFAVRIPVPFLVDERVDTFQPDIIHSHHPYLLGDTAMRVAKKWCLPLVFTHHTLYEAYTHYVTRESDLLKQFVIHLSTEYANCCDTVVAPSASLHEIIRERGVCRPIHDIPTGVDLKHFQNGDGAAFRKNRRLPSTAFVIGHVGRLAPEKNLDYLAHAVAAVIKNTPDSYFLCVGSGDDKKKIARYFEKEDLSSHLVMPGNQTGQSLVDAYHAMDCFAFSSHSETQGMVLTEAMAAGKPVIALDATGVREVVQDAYNGRLLSASAQQEEFADALKGCIGHPETLRKWSENARKTAANFDRRRCATQLEVVYNDAINTHTPHPNGMNMDDHGPLDDIIQRIKTELEVVSTKINAIKHMVTDKGGLKNGLQAAVEEPD